jgi:hypothetical protein
MKRRALLGGLTRNTDEGRRGDGMKRRAFVQRLAASAVLWPFSGLAQTTPKRPVIGFLSPGSKSENAYYSGFQA